MSIERRIFRGEFRDVPGSKGRQKWATAVTYNTVDDYGTMWLPGVFDEALRQRMPTILYGHDWANLEHVLGSGIDFRQTPASVGPPGVDVLMEFADPGLVPASGLAMALLAPDATSKGAVLTDVSVGFERREWLRRDALSPEQLAAGAEEAMKRAGMDELSLVVRGAVKGAQVRSRTSNNARMAADLAAGRITPAQYRAWQSLDRDLDEALQRVSAVRRRASAEPAQISLAEARRILERRSGRATEQRKRVVGEPSTRSLSIDSFWVG